MPRQCSRPAGGGVDRPPAMSLEQDNATLLQINRDLLNNCRAHRAHIRLLMAGEQGEKVGCKKTFVSVGKRVAAELGPVLLRGVARTVAGLVDLDLSGDDKKRVAIAYVKRHAHETGREVTTSAIELAVVASHIALNKAGGTIEEIGEDDQELVINV